MSFAQIIDGQPVEQDPLSFGDNLISQASVALWSPEDAIAHGFYAIVEPEERQDMLATPTGLALVNGAVVRQATYALNVPSEITRRQGRLELAANNMLDPLEQHIAQADIDTRIAYEDARGWRRNDAFVAVMGAALGLTDSQIDYMFISASKRAP